MSRGKNNKSGKPVARAVAKYTVYNVNEPAELMDFLMQKMAGISRSKVKTMLTNRVILVDNIITTQYNFELKPGMKVQVSKTKNNREFKNPMLKLVYEDAYIIVVEKKEGLLSVSTEHQKERTAQHILNEYVKRSHRNNRIFVVHRLDRETSGLMMYAKDEKTQNTLRDNWQDIVTDRRYVAIVSREMEKDGGTVEFGGGVVKEHIGGIYDFLQKKKIENLNELQLSSSPTASAMKKEEEPVSENKLSYEAQKELNKKLRKLEKQVADCEQKIEKLEAQIAEVEAKMATPEGASDMSLYEQHQQLKKDLDAVVEEWESVSIELEEAQG